jgi:1-aminocyclopropane-1-carboxylate deaminase
MNMDISLKEIAISTLELQSNFQIDMLRLDTLHPTISGNKWFKLKYNLQQALEQKCAYIITHGGPFSNHLHATAYACKQLKIPCIGLVNGKDTNNQTLQDCEAWGMELQFIGYANKEKTIDQIVQSIDSSYFIPMGGDNDLGLKGAMEILQNNTHPYSHIVCSVGTGTTFMGLLSSMQPHQKLIGITAIADATVADKIKKAFPQNNNWEIFSDYTFGGFAKINDELEDYLFQFYDKHSVELDAVYTAKMMFGVEDLLYKNYFEATAKILCIHTGGLQGNAGFGIELAN